MCWLGPLLTTTGAREVEIASHNLEDAFSPSPQAILRDPIVQNPLSHNVEGFPHDHHALSGMSATFLRTDLRCVLRNRRALIFAVIMPAVLYLVFGATQKSSDTVGSGNVAFYVLIGMAVHGAIIAAASNAASWWRWNRSRAGRAP